MFAMRMGIKNKEAREDYGKHKEAKTVLWALSCWFFFSVYGGAHRQRRILHFGQIRDDRVCEKQRRGKHTRSRSRLITRFYLTDWRVREQKEVESCCCYAYPGSAHLDHISKPTLRDGVNFACAHQQAVNFLLRQWSN
jgi:hypothetical protein